MDTENTEIKAKEEIHIFLCSDDNYIGFCATCMASVLFNTQSFIHFYIFGTVSPANRRLTLALKEKFSHFDVEFIDADAEKVCKNFMIPSSIGSHLNQYTYLRLIVPLLKPEVKRAIYLDCDIVVLRDIAELWNQDMEGKTLGAVPSVWLQNDFLEHLRTEYEVGDKYFNAGVLLMDCEKWHEENIFQKSLEIQANAKISFPCCDQDLLNILFDRNYKELPTRFNVIARTPESEGLERLKMSEAEALEAQKNAVVVHFAGKCHPWEYHHKLKALHSEDFWNYCNMTEFASGLQMSFIRECCQFVSHLEEMALKYMHEEQQRAKLLHTQSINLFGVIPLLRIKNGWMKLFGCIPFLRFK